MDDEKNMKPICFIGARGGSKGVPKKNIRIIGGKPLLAYTIEKAIKSKFFSHTIVSTEDPEIIKISKLIINFFKKNEKKQNLHNC